MDKGTELLKEYRSLALKKDEASQRRRLEILDYVKGHSDDFSHAEMKSALDSWFNDIKAKYTDIQERALREQMSDEMYKLLPMKYIANHYFSKSVSWLSQRLNGTKVRGKSYSLNEEQKSIFNNAMADLSKKFGSFRLA